MRCPQIRSQFIPADAVARRLKLYYGKFLSVKFPSKVSYTPLEDQENEDSNFEQFTNRIHKKREPKLPFVRVTGPTIVL